MLKTAKDFALGPDAKKMLASKKKNRCPTTDMLIEAIYKRNPHLLEISDSDRKRLRREIPNPNPPKKDTNPLPILHIERLPDWKDVLKRPLYDLNKPKSPDAYAVPQKWTTSPPIIPGQRQPDYFSKPNLMDDKNRTSTLNALLALAAGKGK
ncbi:uncharacterized protein Dwil_GK19818 [Drosophila willistoni]|uniref:Uncharacterized protein n=2 Tax=Drosophila willistoni TaxID=7260 RepID=B4MSW9_DROWI|nr:uncharacterized protein Dwil_GK19818 [Drosophila willistoni]